MMPAPAPDRFVAAPDGRRLAVDDRGDPHGVPVLFLHGTPDTRVARHPDDDLATAAGVRLVAVDRPGLGASDPDPTATPRSVADDHVRVLDALGVERAAVLSWSAGAIFALALAGAHPDRVSRLVLVAPLVPADAYADPGTLHGSDESRHLFASVIEDSDPDEAGRELAMWLVPPEIDEATARTLLADSIEAVRGVPGADEALVAALMGSVASGMTGLEREVAAQATLLGPLLDAVRAPVHVHVGADDRLTPVAMARWLSRRLGAGLTEHPGAGHALGTHRLGTLDGRECGIRDRREIRECRVIRRRGRARPDRPSRSRARPTTAARARSTAGSRCGTRAPRTARSRPAPTRLR